MAFWSVPRMWDGGVVFILGGGPSMPRQFGIPEELIQQVMKGIVKPSAYSPYMESIQGKHVIGVNNAYQLGDWLDVLFFGDSGWYVVHRRVILNLPVLKVTCCERFAKPEKYCDGIKYVARDRSKMFGIHTDPSKVCWNNNSGAAAINLAAHFGAKKIVLLGFDMNLDTNKTSHWFGSYNRLAKKPIIPPFARHLKGFDKIKSDANALGISILNCSPTSSIHQFPRISLTEALEEINHEGCCSA